jgi:hypothetical protein
MVILGGNASNLPQYLQENGAVNIPNSWGVNRAKWFFIRGNE